jgi:polyhydroxyalkanoate synthase subunit PhaE
MMEHKQQEIEQSQAMAAAWMKASTLFWNSVLQKEAKDGEQLQPEDNKSNNRVVESWESAMNAARAFSSVAMEPAMLDGVFNGVHEMPGILLKIIQPAWNGFFHLHQEFLKRVGRIGESTAAYKFENLDQEVFRVLTDIYEKEFRQFLNVPQLGLTRVYQERMARLTDRFNVFQTTMAEFLSLLYLPVEKSTKVMQEKLAAMVDDRKLPESSKAFYNLWVKTLEGHYMNLFKSPEYNETLGKTLSSFSDFVAARQQLLQDMIQFLPIPTQKDMDELYKEIYYLKKRVRELERSAQKNSGKKDNFIPETTN